MLAAISLAATVPISAAIREHLTTSVLWFLQDYIDVFDRR